MAILRDIIAHFGVTTDASALERLDSLMGKVKDGAVALGAALGLSRLVSFTNDAAGAADELGDVSERLSISTAALQEWGFAAKLSGSSAEEFQGSISHLVRSLSEAGDGGKEQAAVFRKLGVQVKDSAGNLRQVDELLPEIADGLSKIENPTERAALAMRVFGRGAQPLVPLLSKGAAGVEELRQQFRDLGGGFSDEAIKQASDYEDQLDRLDVVSRKLKSDLLNALLPAFTRVAEVVQVVGQWFDYLVTKTYLLEAALTVLGVRAAWLAVEWAIANNAILVATIKTWATVGASIAGAAAGVAVIVLALEDLITLFSGGKSAIGEFIDSIFGIGAAEEAVISIKQGWDLLVYSIQKAIYEAKKFAGLDVGAEPEDPETIRERRRQQAVASGDVNAFAREHAAGRTREQAVEDFKASRAAYLKQHPEAATEKDVGAGLATQVGGPSQEKTVSAPKKRSGSTVNNSSNVTVNLPPGTSEEQAERIRKIVAEEQAKQNARTAANGQEEGDV